MDVINKGKRDNLKKDNKFVNRLEYENKDCPRCGYKLTIFSVVPLKGTSKYSWMRFCPHCELIWPP